eukprot:2778296-Pyramimonas_sp.AAC.1
MTLDGIEMVTTEGLGDGADVGHGQVDDIVFVVTSGRFAELAEIANDGNFRTDPAVPYGFRTGKFAEGKCNW